MLLSALLVMILQINGTATSCAQIISSFSTIFNNTIFFFSSNPFLFQYNCTLRNISTSKNDTNCKTKCGNVVQTNTYWKLKTFLGIQQCSLFLVHFCFYIIPIDVQLFSTPEVYIKNQYIYIYIMCLVENIWSTNICIRYIFEISYTMKHNVPISTPQLKN